MAIVINGSGTVTGLSVGGLPDGTVDTDTLANTTVTAAKVAADVATQAELDAASVGGATGVDFNDNVAVRLGTGNDLKLIHDGSNSYIEDTGTGALRILSSYFNVRNPADSESMIAATENGAVELFHNDSKKFETTAAGVTVTGDITLGNNNDFLVSKVYSLGTMAANATVTISEGVGCNGAYELAVWNTDGNAYGHGLYTFTVGGYNSTFTIQSAFVSHQGATSTPTVSIVRLSGCNWQVRVVNNDSDAKNFNASIRCVHSA